jgi:hypothetical protein
MTTSFEHDSRGLAEMYDRVSDQQLEGGKRIAERLGLTDGSRVLDVGGARGQTPPPPLARTPRCPPAGRASGASCV